jgi:hypothetical protein
MLNDRRPSASGEIFCGLASVDIGVRAAIKGYRHHNLAMPFEDMQIAPTRHRPTGAESDPRYRWLSNVCSISRCARMSRKDRRSAGSAMRDAKSVTN